MMTGTVNVRNLKQKYIRYFEDVPIQRYAAMAIARNEDTIIRWRNKDPEFADAVLRAKAEWIRKRLLATKAEFALERLEKEIFSQSSNLTLDTKDKINETYDPNDSGNKKIIDKTLEVMMNETKRQ